MQLRTIAKSKIHHGTVTQADLDYVGSIGIDAGLLRLADIVTGEKVAVWNVSTGARIETYAIPLEEGSGKIVVNGAAARHFHRGDKVIIVAFVLTDEPIQPKMFLVDANNAFVAWLPAEGSPPLAVLTEPTTPNELP
jgi:aspartate 1-decarboxylase